MTGRQIFSESEKVCLQELIVKYKLNSTATIGAGNPAVKKTAWTQLTNEFNSIETNSKRTEVQLKKCWDNLKSRRKMSLAAEKRERMRTGGGPFTMSQPSTSTVTQESMLIDGDALAESTDVELTFAIDSDAMIPGIGSQEETPHFHQEEPTVHASEVQLEETLTVTADSGPVGTQQQHTVSSEERPITSQTRRSTGRTNSRLSDYEGMPSLTGSRNYRNQVIQDEFSLREEKYRRAQAREEELHQLKIQEHMWLVKAAEELFKKNKLEREAAELQIHKLKNQ